MRIHFIAIGGAAMHNLAIALKKNGYIVTGSDDEIFEPSKSRLLQHSLLPEKHGWYPENISKEIDFIILGMHARKDNPELIKAMELGIKIYSYPEFLYEKTKNKKRIVIGGSHGKTTVTSMVMFVLKAAGINFDYMVGANIQGFDTMVNLNDNNKIAVFEGDEYLSSPIDLRPKFHWYKPDIAVITGIAWDHINVFPSFENYLEQFDIFIKSVNFSGELFWFEKDQNLKELVYNNPQINASPYSEMEHQLKPDGTIAIEYLGEKYKLNIFGKHNLQNLNAAYLICKTIGISKKDFLTHITAFKGAARRLQLLAENKSSQIFLDFAHAPSKVAATVAALREKASERKLVACLELHTFSSLKKEFLPQYKNTMKEADLQIVYFNHKVIEHKKLEPINEEYVKNCFGQKTIIFTDTQDLQNYLLRLSLDNTNLLFMSSGNFNGINFADFAEKLISER
jgi:UDP-N-acetylmuramate: L-alanyl-gamma-D-glutamyl-meso-diaminopimelate ligase